MGQLSEQFAGSALPQPSTSGRQQQVWDQAGPGQGLAELTQPDGAQVPAAGDISNEGQQSAAQLGALEALRQEQARLKAEYDRMEVRVSNLPDVSQCHATPSYVVAATDIYSVCVSEPRSFLRRCCPAGICNRCLQAAMVICYL